MGSIVSLPGRMVVKYGLHHFPSWSPCPWNDYYSLDLIWKWHTPNSCKMPNLTVLTKRFHDRKECFIQNSKSTLYKLWPLRLVRLIHEHKGSNPAHVSELQIKRSVRLLGTLPSYKRKWREVEVSWSRSIWLLMTWNMISFSLLPNWLPN